MTARAPFLEKTRPMLRPWSSPVRSTPLALLAALSCAACAPVGASPRPRALPEPTPSPCAGADAGTFVHLLDADATREDVRMPASTEPFSIEPDAPRVTVYAAERAFLAVRLTRAPEHRAYVELKASGLPPNVAAIAAIGADPSEVGFVIEAADTARPITDTAFTLEAHADGVRVSRRVLLTILPERPVPEE
ncbi:MAG: hypothetical protein K1X94_06550 [Sandaracinaceae bacterium]|nr:hypothetical protein [Sandaracinaceae bacterium]